MQTITLTARFDGQHILLDEPCVLEPNTALMVTIVPKVLTEPEDQEAWSRLAAQNLALAYGEDEPDYTAADLVAPNPDYRGS